MSKEEFTWPWQYNFPPFFTLQPNTETRRKQLEAWCQFILSYCQEHKQTNLDTVALMDPKCELFNNRKIHRQANPEMINIILDELHKRGCLEWNDKYESLFH